MHACRLFLRRENRVSADARLRADERIDMRSEAQGVRFDDFEYDFRQRELRRKGISVRLTGKPLQVLEMLLQRPGRVVTRKEMQRRLWSDGTFVDFENNLNSAVNKLREAMGDTAEKARYLQTVPRRGYRFIAPLQSVASHPSKVRPSRGRVRLWLAVTATFALLAGAGILERGSGRIDQPQGVRLAVLPFRNLDSGPQERSQFFSDGLTEELISHLGRIAPKQLVVIAPTSSMAFKNSPASLREIAEQLNVEYLLTGSVRRSEDDLRIAVRLIRAGDEAHLWSEIYQGRLEGVFATQARIAAQVAQALALQLLPPDIELEARAATVNTEAYLAYLEGRHKWNKGTPSGWRASIPSFEKAVRLDPLYALAHVGLAEAYGQLSFAGAMEPSKGYELARQSALKAIALDAGLAEARNALAFVQLHYDWDWEAAQDSFQTSLQINPGLALAHHRSAALYSALGRHDEAISAVRKALQLDPVSMSVMSDLCWYLLFADRFDEAVRQAEKTLSRHPGHGAAAGCRMLALAARQDFGSAFAGARKILQEMGIDEQRLQQLEGMNAEVAYRNALSVAYEGALRMGSASAINMAMMNAHLDRPDQAFEWLSKAVDARQGWLIFLRVDPRFDSLASDSRFPAILSRIGLPMSAQSPLARRQRTMSAAKQ